METGHTQKCNTTGTTSSTDRTGAPVVAIPSLSPMAGLLFERRLYRRNKARRPTESFPSNHARHPNVRLQNANPLPTVGYYRPTRYRHHPPQNGGVGGLGRRK